MITNVEPTILSGSDPENMGLGLESLGQQDFLKLLITQLQHQDPMNPMEAKDITAELAQYSVLEQSIQTNQTLNKLLLYEQAGYSTRALDLVGKEVTAEGGIISLTDDEAEISYELGAETESTDVYIYDTTGTLVRIINGGNQEAGEQTVTWDGKDQSGQALPNDLYYFEVVGATASGETVSANSYIKGVVDSVQFDDNGNAQLMIGGIPVSWSNIIEVAGQPSA